jgi:hypothetical protein
MKYLELSTGWDEVFVRLPGWNGLYWKFTGLEWTLQEIQIHRAGMEFTRESPGCYETRKVHQVGMDFTGDSPSWNGFYWRFTGLE